MRASIVPRRNKCRRRTAIGVLGAFGGLVALVALAAASRGEPGRARAAPPAEHAEPSFSGRTDEMLWSDDFDGRLRPEPPRRRGDAGRLGRYLTLGDPFVRHDPDGGLAGSGAVRMDWLPRRGSARCDDDSRMLEASFEPSNEVVIQFAVRYTPGFVFDWGARGRCSGNAKKLFLLWSHEGSRFVFISENGALGVGSDHDHPLLPQNRGTALRPGDLADGRWHRVTFHIRQGSATDRPDGFVRGWIDGVERWHYPGIVTHNAGGYHLFKFPTTFNQGSPAEQSEWVDALRLWRPR